RDAAQITRDRATARAVALAARLAERTPAQRQGWRGRRLTRRLSKAVGRASVGTDPQQRVQLLDQLAARRHALALATVPLPSPWSPNHDNVTTPTVPSLKAQNASVPKDGPQLVTELIGDRGPRKERGPVPGTWDHDAGTEERDAGTETGTEPVRQEPNQWHEGSAGTGCLSVEVPAQAQGSHRGPTSTGPGTEPTGDRGPTSTGPGTEPTGDRGPTSTGPGTEPTGDRGHKVPLPRKPTAKARGKRNGQSRSPQPDRPPRELEQSVDQLAQQVRPHVPALLARDGNEAVTRVQLREILRREGLTGGRNDRLSLVLQHLRNDDTAKTRSTAR
ncbi:hypothetical protein O3W51_45910, partial [Streptomyces sp. H39-C1]|nr:hypothetical protein [Streptomyces sp. H39-C1]